MKRCMLSPLSDALLRDLASAVARETHRRRRGLAYIAEVDRRMGRLHHSAVVMRGPSSLQRGHLAEAARGGRCT